MLLVIKHKETACALILAEESALLTATNKDTRAATPMSMSNFTCPIQVSSNKPLNLPSLFPLREHSDDPRSEPSYVPSGSLSIAPSVVPSTISSLNHRLVPSLVPSSSPYTDPSNFQSEL